MRCTVYKVPPEDGLIQSETCRAYNEKIKSNHKNLVHLIGLYTYNLWHYKNIHFEGRGNPKNKTAKQYRSNPGLPELEMSV